MTGWKTNQSLGRRFLEQASAVPSTPFGQHLAG
jgi:hypothetical protein